jgi:hypothetical protein
MMRRAVESNVMFAVMLGVVLSYAVARLWPASWWLEVRSVLAFNSLHGADVVMQVDRTIHRPFTAEWRVLVRKLTPDGRVEIVCAAAGGGNYRPDAALPDPMTLAWWTNGQCPNPPPGQILVSTIWTINTGLPGQRSVVADSNIFTVESDG